MECARNALMDVDRVKVHHSVLNAGLIMLTIKARVKMTVLLPPSSLTQLDNAYHVVQTARSVNHLVNAQCVPLAMLSTPRLAAANKIVQQAHSKILILNVWNAPSLAVYVPQLMLANLACLVLPYLKSSADTIALMDTTEHKTINVNNVHRTV